MTNYSVHCGNWVLGGRSKRVGIRSKRRVHIKWGPKKFSTIIRVWKARQELNQSIVTDIPVLGLTMNAQIGLVVHVQ